MPLKRALKLVVSISILAAIGLTIARRDGLEELVARLQELDWRWLFAASAMQLVAALVGVERWAWLLRGVGLSISRRWLARQYLVGRFVGVLTPSTAGLDLYRVMAVARVTGERGRAAAPIVREKAFGLVGLSVLVGAAAALGADRLLGSSEGLIAAAAVPLGLALLTRRSLALGALRLAPAALRRKLQGPIEALTQGGHGLGASVGLAALSVGSHLLTAAVFFATARALGLAAGTSELLLAGLGIVIATLLPLSVSGFGVREGAAVLLLGALGISPLDATLVALLGYLSTQPPALIGGLLTFAPEPAARVESARPVAAAPGPALCSGQAAARASCPSTPWQIGGVALVAEAAPLG